jgi:hypothetical protein
MCWDCYCGRGSRIKMRLRLETPEILRRCLMPSCRVRLTTGLAERLYRASDLPPANPTYRIAYHYHRCTCHKLLGCKIANVKQRCLRHRFRWCCPRRRPLLRRGNSPCPERCLEEDPSYQRVLVVQEACSRFRLCKFLFTASATLGCFTAILPMPGLP